MTTNLQFWDEEIGPWKSIWGVEEGKQHTLVRCQPMIDDCAKSTAKMCTCVYINVAPPPQSMWQVSIFDVHSRARQRRTGSYRVIYKRCAMKCLMI